MVLGEAGEGGQVLIRWDIVDHRKDFKLEAYKMPLKGFKQGGGIKILRFSTILRCRLVNGLERSKSGCYEGCWETIVLKQERNHGSRTKKLTVGIKKKRWSYLSRINRSR